MHHIASLLSAEDAVAFMQTNKKTRDAIIVRNLKAFQNRQEVLALIEDICKMNWETEEDFLVMTLRIVRRYPNEAQKIKVNIVNIVYEQDEQESIDSSLIGAARFMVMHCLAMVNQKVVAQLPEDAAIVERAMRGCMRLSIRLRLQIEEAPNYAPALEPYPFDRIMDEIDKLREGLECYADKETQIGMMKLAKLRLAGPLQYYGDFDVETENTMQGSEKRLIRKLRQHLTFVNERLSKVAQYKA